MLNEINLIYLNIVESYSDATVLRRYKLFIYPMHSGGVVILLIEH